MLRARHCPTVARGCTLPALPYTHDTCAETATMPIVHIDHIDLHYDTRGAGEPLLLIMGYRGSGFLWREELLTLLTRHFQVIFFDNRGTGLSDKPTTLYTIPMMADDAAGLLRHLRIRRAHVFGVSMGGMIAQELALRHPQLVQRLILGCTSCGGPQATLAPMEVLAKLIPPPDLPPEEAVQRQWTVMLSTRFLETRQLFLTTLTQQALLYPAPRHTSILHMMAVQRFNTYGRLGLVTAPTLVVTGAEMAYALGRGVSLSRMASLDETYKYVTQGTFYVMIISLPAGRHGAGGAVPCVNALY